MTAIEDFLAQKPLATNSRQAYAYDLEQFRQVVDGEIDAVQLQRYQQEIGRLKPSVQKRKLSAVNQFLAYLYEKGQLKTFYRLKGKSLLGPVTASPKEHPLLDLSIFEQDCETKAGQLIALLILHLGLQPSDICHLKVSAIDVLYGVITIERQGQVRVLRLSQKLLPYLEPYLKGPYLLGKGDKSYSRQWLFKALKDFLIEINQPDLNAQKLREQHILHQLKTGLSLQEIAQRLGLKGTTTLERYQFQVEP